MTYQIEKTQKLLEGQIEKFNRKKDLINTRSKFKNSKEELQKLISEVGVDYDDSLDTEIMNIHIYRGKYNNEKVLGITNSLIVIEVVTNLIEKIELKIVEIEAEILKG